MLNTFWLNTFSRTRGKATRRRLDCGENGAAAVFARHIVEVSVLDEDVGGARLGIGAAEQVHVGVELQEDKHRKAGRTKENVTRHSRKLTFRPLCCEMQTVSLDRPRTCHVKCIIIALQGNTHLYLS